MIKANTTLKGKVDSIRRVPTHTGTSMTVFSVGGIAGKVFGHGANMMLNLSTGDLVELEGYYETRTERFGREFVALGVKQLDGDNTSAASVTEVEQVTDKKEAQQPSMSPAAVVGKKCPHCGSPMNCRDAVSGLSAEGSQKVLADESGRSVTAKPLEPANNPIFTPATLSEKGRSKVNEAMIAPWVESFSDLRHSDSDLEKKVCSPHEDSWVQEAARRVLERRKAQYAELARERAAYAAFEAMENEYKSLKATHELEKANQLTSQAIKEGQTI